MSAMFDRMSTLMGAGVVTAGVSAAMLAGAGVAIADVDPGAGGETSTSVSSATSNAPTGRGEIGTDAPDDAGDDDAADADADAGDADPDVEDSEDDDAEGDDPDDTEGADDAADAEDADTDADAEQAESGDPGSDPVGETDSAGGIDEVVIEPSTRTDPAAELDVTTSPIVEGTVHEAPVAELAEPTGPSIEAAGSTETRTVEQVDAGQLDTEPSPTVATLATAPAEVKATAEISAPRQTLLSIVGTIVFNLYSFAVRVVGGPPLLPWGSTVTVRSSRVEIDCGDGYVVPADWYVPEGPTPTRLIYLQHGFLAAGPFYSYTASRLAEATHSIVVTTSLTSNFLACDGCWVGGTQMHEAVAGLFGDGNTALADSATAAGYSSSLLSGVEQVVLMGHSAGGGLAAGAAGYMAEIGMTDRLAGVVMLDGVGFGQVLPEALAKLPDEVPIYNLAGKAYFWNINGSAGIALEQARPGEFHGVRLIGGRHSDTMLGGNPLIQGALNLVTGWSKVENVKAAEILSAAWVNDMFTGAPTPRSPYYGAAGDTLTIDTPRGTATAYVMPGPPERLTFIDRVFGFFSGIAFGLDFAACVAPSAGPSTEQAGDLIEMSTFSAPNAPLSLDGRTKAGQSIGQQCVQG